MKTLTLYRLGFLNVNHLSLIECWTVSPDFPGFEKFEDTTAYYNTLFVKSNKQINVELVDHRYGVAGDLVLYCLYLPPGH